MPSHRISDVDRKTGRKDLTFKRADKRPLKNKKMEENPESILNRLFLVTAHRGGFSWILYHGNNQNIAEQTFNTSKAVERSRIAVKLWLLGKRRAQAPSV